MFEDDDLELDFGDALLEPMTILKSNPTFRPKMPVSTSSSNLRSSNQPYPTHPPPEKKPLSTPVRKNQNDPKPDFTFKSPPPKTIVYDRRNPAPTPSPVSAPITTHNPDQALARHHQPQPSPKAGMVRRFPGPAGLLPKLAPGVHKAAKEEDNEEKIELDEDNIECEGVGDCVAWKRAMEELGMVSKDSLVERFNTNWIKNKSQAGATKKMPFFLCKIVKMDLTSADPMVMLVDNEGKVEGSMHRDVVEQFSKDVRVGSVLVLQSVVVLVTARKEYVNITLNNLVAIYTKTNVKQLKRVSKEDMMVVARELDRVREQQLKSILGGESQPSPSSSPQSLLSPAWSSPQVRHVTRAPDPPMVAPVPQMRPSTISRAPSSPIHPPPTQHPPLTPPVARNTFTFKPHTTTTRPHPFHSTQLGTSQAQSQHLVASLMSDLDTSDIFSDF